MQDVSEMIHFLVTKGLSMGSPSSHSVMVQNLDKLLDLR